MQTFMQIIGMTKWTLLASENCNNGVLGPLTRTEGDGPSCRVDSIDSHNPPRKMHILGLALDAGRALHE